MIGVVGLRDGDARARAGSWGARERNQLRRVYTALVLEALHPGLGQ